MGIAASQARLIMLAARQSNLQYMGQQINQERSILAQQCSALYNSLLTMTVPTPPSTTDYTKVQYKGTVGATTYNFATTDVRPQGNNEYVVTLTTAAYGHSLDKDSGLATTTPAFIVNTLSGTTSSGKMFECSYTDGVYVYQDGEYKPATSDMQNQDPQPIFYKYYANGSAMPPSGTGIDVTINPPTVGGNRAFNIDQGLVQGSFTQEMLDDYITAIQNSGLKDSEGLDYDENDFYIYFTQEGNAKFVLKQDVDDGNDKAVTYSYIANGQYEKRVEYEKVTLDFDTSGRILSMNLPNVDASGNMVGYTYIPLSAETITDTNAYNDAYAKYEYAQYEYDRMQQEINAKTEIIQQQDKNLELKLQRYDTENREITAEKEALDKVLQDAVQKSYKTFSG